jgi:two-component sensor histidine kinase
MVFYLPLTDGRISISGKIDRYNGGGSSFVFSWMESGGPRVTLPTRRGFGSAIILEAAQQLGNVSMIYRPEGLVYQLEVDLKEIKSSSVKLGEGRVRSA